MTAPTTRPCRRSPQLQTENRSRRLIFDGYLVIAISAPGRSQRMISTSVPSSIATHPAVGTAVGGVQEERAAVAGHPCLVDAHHDCVRVLRDVEVLGAARPATCRTGTCAFLHTCMVL